MSGPPDDIPRPSEPDKASMLSCTPITLDPRRPMPLEAGGQVLQVVAGHVDVFAVDGAGGTAPGRRSHLLRFETGEIILDLHGAFAQSGRGLEIILVGGGGAEAAMLPLAQITADQVIRWVNRLAALMSGSSLAATLSELGAGESCSIAPGERRRGPARSIAWVTVASGTARLMGLDAPVAAGDLPIPLTAGLWIEAGESGCEVTADAEIAEAARLSAALDRFHATVASNVVRSLMDANVQERELLVRRSELSSRQAAEAFGRLAETLAGRSGRVRAELGGDDPLLSVCRIVAQRAGASAAPSNRSGASGQAIGDVLEIARWSRFRVRRVQLRDAWWKLDAGPLIAWREDGRPVALVRDHRSGYALVDPDEPRQHQVDRAVAGDLMPQALSIYPTLPARPLRYLDLLGPSAVGLSGSILRIAVAVLGIGLLSLIQPLATNLLVNSAIPRTEIDQLLACALALVVTAVSIAGLQVVQGLAMLRLEGLLDYRLQAAMIDRLLRMPAALFRDYTAGDLVDRAMGIDTVRKTLTVRTLRGFTSLLFCIFSIGLMLYYDMRLGIVGLLLVAIRGAVIAAAGGVRIYYETRYLNLQGKIGGLVLQLIAGVGKLRVARATGRALALWLERFAVQKRYFIASQKVANALTAFETSYPTLATLVIFAVAARTNSDILRNLGAFLGFLSAFAQTLASIGTWASSISDSLVAIPQMARLKPLLSTGAEIAEERRSPGELSGEVELSGVTFRYAQGGPPVLDNITLKIARGEYVAIVGPSGSGKSSLLRLLLGFEQPESGTVFYDGKALNTLDISAVRRQLGVVLQDTRLATGSIYENICGGVELPLARAWEAARQAGLDGDIRQMPMGMHTLVSEGVNTLSGGQRQRIMIARAIARAPRILLFDEATSALDNQTQATVAASLEKLAITRLVIAHRLSTVRNADRIIMLSGGKVAQSGSYADLIATPGPFADFARRQLL